jgi:hypothetical protein
MHALQSVLGKRRKSCDNQKRRWIRTKKVDKDEATEHPKQQNTPLPYLGEPREST